jgi:hypothetical protein
MTATFAPLGRMTGLITPPRSTARSEPAMRLSEMQEEIRKHLLSSFVIGNATGQAMAQLENLRTEASFVGWDGYGATPINPFACLYAKLFLNTLPTTAPIPEVSADPDGEVALDWAFGERRMLTVSIGPTGRCTFAWMNGQSTHRGTEWMDDEIPASVAFALSQLDRSGQSRQPR